MMLKHFLFGLLAGPLLLAPVGCHTTGRGLAPNVTEGTCRPSEPREVRHHEWNCTNPELESRLNAWALENVKTGDVLFRMGVSHVLGIWDVSKFFAELSHSRYTHAAIAKREDGQVYVYDVIDPDGYRKITFAEFVTQFGLAFAVVRPRPEYEHAIPQAIAYVEQARYHGGTFDADFQIGNETLYCAELVELAYRSAGVPLSEPLPLGCMPGYEEKRCGTTMIRLGTDLHPEQVVYFPGNSQVGMLASPVLEVVAEFPHPQAVPCPLAPQTEPLDDRLTPPPPLPFSTF